MDCVICKGGGVEAGTTTVTLQRGETVVVIRDVPADVCCNCGEYYLGQEVATRVYDLGEAAVKRGAIIEIGRYVA